MSMPHANSSRVNLWPADGPVGVAAGCDARPGALDRAVIETVAYGDIFDYPLTLGEIHRYLVGRAATPADVARTVAASRARAFLSQVDGFVTLPGREALIERRRHRAAIAGSLWPAARRYGAIIAGLPFVRLVAITGALALDNVEADADIDYFVVTEAGRLWLCRAFVIALVRLAARRGITICPNYFLSERALRLGDRTLFVAHELAQMVPVAASPTYDRLRAVNAWTARFLPNAVGPPRAAGAPVRRPAWVEVSERVARTRLVSPLEQWEMTRKIRRLDRQTDGHGEASFTADWCKGHFGDYGARVVVAFDARRRRLGLTT